MYSVLIVDDERRVRQGLADNVDWESFGFRVIGSESNGKRAFEFIEQQLPDVLLTDIRMPVMSGLELMDLVHIRYPSIKMVALSGYDEFEYAQQALKYGVLDYILKPTKIRDLRLAFTKLKTILDNEKEKKKQEEKLQQQLKEAQPLLREKCLYDIVKGRTEDNNKIREKISFLGLDIGEKSFCVLLAEVGALSKPGNEMNEQSKQFLMFSIMNVIEETTREYCKASIFSQASSSIIILLSDDNIDTYELEVFNCRQLKVNKLGVVAIMKDKKGYFARTKVQDTIAGYLFIMPNLVGFLVFTLGGILFSLMLSFTNWSLLKDISDMKFIGLRNFAELYKDKWFIDAFWNNIWFLCIIPIILLKIPTIHWYNSSTVSYLEIF
jgi:YesN/AraC family two-component response regulator